MVTISKITPYASATNTERKNFSFFLVRKKGSGKAQPTKATEREDFPEIEQKCNQAENKRT
jgi:hypothetical protein